MGKQKGSILCVEDQLNVCELIAIVLSGLGYEVVKAHTYADALLKCLRLSFDLYIINSGLPDGAGAELCKEIRARNSQTPIIFTTGGDSTKEFSEAKAIGINAILNKPFKLAELEALVTQLLPG